MSLQAGMRLGPYGIVSPLGSGGMGEVWRARDPRLKRDVAIKVLPQALSADPETMRRFEREAHAVSALNHPNILTIHDLGVQDGIPYVVLELLEGETLRQVINEGSIPPRQVTEYAVQIAHGLAAAHEKGIVHRDLKPENLFRTLDGRIKILDFGIARQIAPAKETGDQTNAPTLTSATEPGVVMGTVGYMSPEQVRGKPADSRSDIFSFGAVLYEMLTGQRAFRGESPIETMSAILKEDPPALTAVRSDIPPGYQRIVRRCLEKNPDQRFQSARDLAFALTGESAPSLLPTAPIPAALSRARPRRALLLAAGGLAVLAVLFFAARALRGPTRRLTRAAGPISSLAVLPLDNLSKDPGQEYFSDGMTEELIATLARLGGVRVISRTSVMGYKGTKKTLPQIAQELGVDAIIEGSVMRSGEKVRITAQLIHGASDKHLWAESYQRDLRDVLAMQSEVARAIAREIEAKVTLQGEKQLAAARQIDPEAHELYLRGRYELNKQTETSLRNAIQNFQKAVAREPRFSLAYAGIADAYSFLRSNFVAPRDVMPQAKEAARKALEIDDTLAEPHVSMGMIRFFYDYDWAGAEKDLKRAIEINSNLAEAHDAYATFLVAVKRPEEAMAQMEAALRLDPVSTLILADAAWVYYCARKYDRAIEVSRKSIELDPGFWISHTFLGLALEKTGRYAEAVDELQKARKLDDNATIYEMLGGAYAAWGKKAEAQKVVKELTDRAERRYVCPYEVATIYVGLGQKDEAFRWLEKSVEARADCTPWVQADSKLDPLRSDPRYEALLKSVNLR